MALDDEDDPFNDAGDLPDYLVAHKPLSPAREAVFGASFDPTRAMAHDPSELAWPVTLPIEIALGTDTIQGICESYGIDRERWQTIRTSPHFKAELGRTLEALRIDGMAFKMRAALQSNELLKESWRIIHDMTVPANVRLDAIKSTVKWAGLDASANKDAAAGGNRPTFMIQINLA